MGYYAHSCESDFLILKERQDDLSVAIKEHFINYHDIQVGECVENMFYEFGLCAETNDHGDINCLYFEHDKFHSDELEEFWGVIAMFVEPGSYITFQGEDDSMWAYYFDGLSWEEFWAEITYPGMSMVGPKKPKRDEKKG